MRKLKDHFNGSSWLVSVVLVLLFGSIGFAYGGSVSGTVKEPSAGSAVPWAGIKVKAADTGLLAGTASADALAPGTAHTGSRTPAALSWELGSAFPGGRC